MNLRIYCAGFVCAVCLLGNRVPKTATLMKKRDALKKKLSIFQRFLGRGYFFIFISLKNVFF